MASKKSREATVTVQCITCKAKKEVGPGSEQPICDTCFMPMTAISAKVKLR